MDRFLASQAIMLSVVGVPGIYFHSLFGSRGWREGVQQTGHNRTINRQKLTRAELEDPLSRPGSLRHSVFSRYAHLLRLRASQPAFDPYGDMAVLAAGPQFFGVLRSSAGGPGVVCLQNVTGEPQSLPSLKDGLPGINSGELLDLVSDERLNPENEISFQPYQTRWLVGL